MLSVVVVRRRSLSLLFVGCDLPLVYDMCYCCSLCSLFVARWCYCSFMMCVVCWCLLVFVVLLLIGIVWCCLFIVCSCVLVVSCVLLSS